eukprot:1245921-Prymnesium_polylepis.1
MHYSIGLMSRGTVIPVLLPMCRHHHGRRGWAELRTAREADRKKNFRKYPLRIGCSRLVQRPLTRQQRAIAAAASGRLAATAPRHGAAAAALRALLDA